MCMQCSQLEFLKEDDQNMRADGTSCTIDNEMGKISADFYAQLFSSEASVDADNILAHIRPCVTSDMEERVNTDVMDEEIENALF